MATQPLQNLIDPPPRLTGDSAHDVVAVIQWLSAFYTKGILSGALLQPQNMAPALISLGALPGAADMLAYFTAEDTFDLTGFTAFARTLLDDIDADAARATLGAGDVIGPGASTNNHVAVFDGVTGKLLKDGGAPAGDVVGPAGAVDGNVVLFDTATGKLVKDGGTLGTAAFTASTAYQPADADLTTWAGITPGANVGTALAVAVGTDGAFVVKGGALGTPSSGVVTNLTGTGGFSISGGTVKTGGAYAAAVANATPKTMLTLPSNSGIFQVYAYLYATGAPAAYHAFATISTGSGAAAIQLQHDGSNITITLSGMDVQVTQSSGSAQDIYLSYLNMPQ